MSGYGAFSEVYDLLTDDIDYPARAAYFDRLLLQNGRGERGRLLDLACGTGALSEPLAQLGWSVTGVDGSPDMLTFAESHRMQSGLPIQYVCQQMEQLNVGGGVNAAVCALDSLNHITDPALLGRALARVASALVPGGVFVFDVNTPYKHREILGNNTFVYDYDEVFLVWRNTLLEHDTVQLELDLFEPEGALYRRSQESFCERAYSSDEWADFLRQAGLQTVAVYAADTVCPPAANTQRWVYITKKEQTK